MGEVSLCSHRAHIIVAVISTIVYVYCTPFIPIVYSCNTAVLVRDSSSRQHTCRKTTRTFYTFSFTLLSSRTRTRIDLRCPTRALDQSTIYKTDRRHCPAIVCRITSAREKLYYIPIRLYISFQFPTFPILNRNVRILLLKPIKNQSKNGDYQQQRTVNNFKRALPVVADASPCWWRLGLFSRLGQQCILSRPCADPEQQMQIPPPLRPSSLSFISSFGPSTTCGR